MLALIKYLPSMLGHYLLQMLAVRGATGKQDDAVDLCFVIPHYNRGWVLEGICRDIAAASAGTSCFHHSLRNMPTARSYFFPHYSVYAKALMVNPWLWSQHCVVWYTHPKGVMSDRELAFCLNRAALVLSAAPRFQKALQALLKAPERVRCILGAADDSLFKALPKLAKVRPLIGFCSAYYQRKAPEKMAALVAAMPDCDFLLLGKGWEGSAELEAMNAAANFRYVQAKYQDYPAYYQQMDVLVSTSLLEGGPIPLIEALMCNVVPVASDTGFAEAIIDQGKNGFVFPVDAETPEIIACVRQALLLAADDDVDVSRGCERYSWEAFAEQLWALLPAANTQQGGGGGR